ncbi:MAG: electron transport complex subunit RsxD [Gammaproteobacteria bacterium]|nr:electron transport complex subunit RsxD [Gammaproteobacteria bacterium]
MLFRKASSPFISAQASVHSIMYQVLYALIPGTLAAIYFFGWGILINLLITTTVCLLSEAIILKLRARPVSASLKDGSTLITACLLALALPPLVPWWLTMIASIFAIAIAKQLYGGLGFNLFNPAMVGYIVVMISFPGQMTFWTAPLGISDGWLSLGDTFSIIFHSALPDQSSIDSVTMATPIDAIKTQLSLEHDIANTRQHKVYGALFGNISGRGWEWINLLFLLSGLWLIKQKVIDWRIPVSFLVSLLLISNLFAVIDYASYPSALFHLFSGGTMLCAFFIATDPISASTTPRGRWIFGAGIAVLTYTIRTWGGYPDGIAFAVVLMNMTVPLLDYYTQPKIYGNRKVD